MSLSGDIQAIESFATRAGDQTDYLVWIDGCSNGVYTAEVHHINLETPLGETKRECIRVGSRGIRRVLDAFAERSSFYAVESSFDEFPESLPSQVIRRHDTPAGLLDSLFGACVLPGATESRPNWDRRAEVSIGGCAIRREFFLAGPDTVPELSQTDMAAIQYLAADLTPLSLFESIDPQFIVAIDDGEIHYSRATVSQLNTVMMVFGDSWRVDIGLMKIPGRDSYLFSLMAILDRLG